ncbi:MAG: hypothetical protein Q7Q71_13750 [Verrucomicrobiota bacterium JB023]|nr:hypothetical protein [Verrucomicrobiota bacterium JB023]
MKRAAEGLEPADVTQGQLWKTAGLLLAAIVLGGGGILYGYLTHLSKQIDEEERTGEFRPAFADELIGQMRFRLADGEVVDTTQIEEDVWLLMQSSLDKVGQHEEREKALAALPEEGIKKLVFFINVDPNDPEEMALMADLPEEEGTWHIAAKDEVPLKWLKTEVKFGIMPSQKEGEWHYDTSIVVVKRDWPKPDKPRVHVRGERFDFDQAKADAVKGGRPELADGYRDDWFVKTVKILLAEKDPTKEEK